MKYSIDLEQNPNFFSVKASGFGAVSAFKGALQTLLNHPQWQEDAKVMQDYRLVMLSELSPKDVMELAQTVRKTTGILGNTKSAIVVSETEDYNLAKLYITLMDQAETRLQHKLFYDFDEAKEWLFEE